MQSAQHTYKVLVVDDKPDNLFALEQLLAAVEGVQVLQAKNGNEALALTLEHSFCLAIIDVQMPEMDGYELVDLLRGNRPTAQMPVIFVSAIYSDEYHHRKGYEVGAVDFLSKPFVPEILLSKVRVFIDLYEQKLKLEEWSQLMERMVYQRTEELTQAYQRLEKLDKAKTDFIQVAAHELRTPLTLISGYAGLMAEMFRGNEQVINILNGIDTGHDRLLEVINSMLDVSRIDTEALKLHRTDVSLRSMLNETLHGFKEALAERQITVEVDVAEGLPIISADPELIRKMLNQLLGNAIKFTPDGGKVCARVKPIEEDHVRKVELRVVDAGIGIDPANLELIFEKFFQTGEVRFHSTGKTRFKGGGPGLGLAIARGVVLAHGGRIWAESPGYDEEKCPGSTFVVVLPVH